MFKEIDYVAEAYDDKILDTVYIGGGTPTTLEAEELDRLITKVKTKFNKKDMFRQISIYFGEKNTQTIALLDTGNMLKDPITSMSVIVVEKEVLKSILPEIILNNLNKIIGGDVPKEIYEDENLQYITKFRVIPFSSIGKENGMLLGFKANKIMIEEDGNIKELKNIIVGIYEHKLSKKNQYSALIGFDLIERSEENEYITNVSR